MPKDTPTTTHLFIERANPPMETQRFIHLVELAQSLRWFSRHAHINERTASVLKQRAARPGALLVELANQFQVTREKIGQCEARGLQVVLKLHRSQRAKQVVLKTRTIKVVKKA